MYVIVGTNILNQAIHTKYWYVKILGPLSWCWSYKLHSKVRKSHLYRLFKKNFICFRKKWNAWASETHNGSYTGSARSLRFTMQSGQESTVLTNLSNTLVISPRSQLGITWKLPLSWISGMWFTQCQYQLVKKHKKSQRVRITQQIYNIVVHAQKEFVISRTSL